MAAALAAYRCHCHAVGATHACHHEEGATAAGDDEGHEGDGSDSDDSDDLWDGACGS